MNDFRGTVINSLMRIKNSLLKALNAALIIALSILVLDVLWGVITRYIFGEQAAWTEELARAVLVWVVLLGGAVAYGNKEHLGLDYFVNNMDKSSQKKLAIVVTIICLCFSILVLIVGGTTLVRETFELEQTLMALGISKGYVYCAVPVSGIFFCIFGIEELLELCFAKSTEVTHD